MKIFFLRDSLLFFCFGIALLLGFSRIYSMRPAAGVIGECGSIGDTDRSEHGNARYDDDGVQPAADTSFFSQVSIEILCEIFKNLDKRSLVQVASVSKNCASGAQFVLKIQEKERLLEKHDGIIQVGLFDAAAKGITRLLPFLISIEGINLNGVDNLGETALHYAKNAATVDCLVALRADLNQPNSFGETPLIYAVYGSDVEDVEKVKKFVELGANLDCRAKPRKVISCEPFGPVIRYGDDEDGDCVTYTVFEIARQATVTNGAIKKYLSDVCSRRLALQECENASEKFECIFF